MNIEDKLNPKSLSPLTLAFVGDGVYDLMVRNFLVSQGQRPVGELNKMKVHLVNCHSQAEYMKDIIPVLTEDELSIYKRGRNASPKCTPKHGTVGDYHSATGCEALFGYLYLIGQQKRLEELFAMIAEKAEF
jgi:ribonuclease-3 family protein